MFFSKSLSLNKLRQILQDQAKIYKRYPEQATPKIKEDIYKLESLIEEGNREEATKLATDLEKRTKSHYKRSPLKMLFDVTLAIGIALIAATVIRQSWFELYEIPTGSMRPTFREQDHLSVSKTTYGINVPLETNHFYFDQNLVKRGGVVIFSGDGIDLDNTDSSFLYVFPYKKRYIKRLIGKPGDSLYFYGGLVYGFDKEGKEIEELQGKGWMEKIEYIPYISIDSPRLQNPNGPAKFKQMNQDVGRLSRNAYGEFNGEFFNGKEWVKDEPANTKKPHDSPQTLTELWGMGNYAKSRIVSKGNGKNFLEINHHPSLSGATPPQVGNYRNNIFFLPTPRKSFIPLDDALMNKIMDNLYTARFVVKDGKATRYSLGDHYNSPVSFPNVPNGTYEFYYGKGYNVGFGGTLSNLPKDHPLMARTPENIKKLYNLGIEFDSHYDAAKDSNLLPTRYTYFRDGDLYVLGAPLLKKGDPILETFVKEENTKALSPDYLPFIDAPPAMTKEFIANFGLKIPEGKYLVLGDNHAMSGDSRVFGFVPENNLQGAPSLILWPFGDRWGMPNMTPYQFITLPRLIVWGIAALCFGFWWWWHKRRLNRKIDI